VIYIIWFVGHWRWLYY